MRNLKFPEIKKKVQQSVYGAWGGSNSNEPVYDGGWLDEVVIGGGDSGGGSGSSGSWDYGDNGSYDNGGYWGDYGGGGVPEADNDFGENFIVANSMLNFAQGVANAGEANYVENQIRNAVNATGLATGFIGTAIDAITAITKEIGFSAKTFGSVGKIGVVGVVIGSVEVYIAAQEAISGEDPWKDGDTLNAISTVLGAAALFPGKHSIVCGGMSVMVGLVGTAYSN